MIKGAKFCVVQFDVSSNLICCTVCKHYSETGLTVQGGTELGLAAKLAGCYGATAEISVAVGLQPAHLAAQRAAETDALCLLKVSK